MSEMGRRIEEELEALRRVRDELRVQMHLAQADARDLWDEMEGKFHELEGKASTVARAAEEPLRDVGEAAKLLVDEIRDGYRRIRKAL